MPNPNASSPVDPQVLTLFQEELARSGALPGLAPAGPALWPRFAGYYQGLAHLPRKARRALQRRWRRSLGGIALLCALGQAPALAATINVGGGCTLVDAITAANSNAAAGGCTAGSGADSIVLPSLSTQMLTTVNNETYGPTGLPVITSEITINGSFPGGSSIARDSSAPEFRILAVGTTGNLTLQRTAVSGGVGLDAGGIHNAGTLTLNSGTVYGNTALYNGGGINNTGTLTLIDSLASGNTAIYNGGGINNTGTVTLTNSTVYGNSADSFGGGIYNFGTVTLTDSTVQRNTAEASSGGIRNRGAMTLIDSLVSGNTADGYGAGIENFRGGTVTLTNSLVSGNTALYGGGGINNSGTLTLTNSTVSGNTAYGISGTIVLFQGGGIENFRSGTVTLTNSLVSGNTTGDSGGGINNGGTLT